MEDVAVDPHLWLEDVLGEHALAWVEERNAETCRSLEAEPGFEELRRRLLAIYDSKERIAYVGKRGPSFYNFWQDEAHERGIWRRTTLDEYVEPEPHWETVLDLDALSNQDGVKWVWKGAVFLEPSFERCLIRLSRGGADAIVTREFDPVAKCFVSDGFVLPEAKGYACYRDRDTLYVATDFGPGSLTDSGYPRLVKEWRRGDPLSAARTLFEGQSRDMWVGAVVSHEHGFVRELVFRFKGMYQHELYVRRGLDLIRVEKPDDATVSTFGPFALMQLRSELCVEDRTFPGGALLVARFDDLCGGRPDYSVLFAPGERSALAGFSCTKTRILLSELDNVHSKLYELGFDGGAWHRRPIAAPPFGELAAWGVDSEESDDYFLSITGPTTPTTLCLTHVGSDDWRKLRALPDFFDPKGLAVSQREALSRDGTRVPYFLVAPEDLPAGAGTPTLLTGYGGFELPLVPGYSATVGSAWLEKGHALAIANIRGGGEFGPRWHQAAQRERRQAAYDDFIAVAEALIESGVTRPERLGIQGGSNGGLLMGVMLTQRPDLFGAVVSESPLLDMRRYHKLLAGASWLDEYGNPDDPADWAFLSRYSPYHHVDPSASYPPVLIMTSTRDDRVHPGHARKMVGMLREHGKAVLYYENTEGGHAGAANHQQAARMGALAYTFLTRALAPR